MFVPPPVRRAVALGLFAVALLARPAFALDQHFTTSPTLQLEAQLLIKVLDEANYNHAEVTQADFGEVIPDYMEALDNQHLFFLASDEAHFKSTYTANTVYANLAYLGNLDAAYDIYYTYEKRVEDRVHWILHTLDGNLDLDSHETFGVDRTKAPWPANAADADDLWRKRLIWEIEGELLSDKQTATAAGGKQSAAAPGGAAPNSTRGTVRGTEVPGAKPAGGAKAAAPAPAAPTLDGFTAAQLAAAKHEVRKRYEGMLKHLNQTDVDDLADLYLTAVTGLYDPHSEYMSPETYEDFGIQMKLQLVGIGAVLQLQDDTCVVKELVPGGPAALGHQLKPEDKIVAVGEGNQEPVDIIGMRLRSIVDLIRGRKGTKVHLVVEPAGGPSSARENITITRDLVKLDSARAHGAVFQVPDGSGRTVPFGVISLPEFYADDPTTQGGARISASADVARLIAQMKQQGIRGLVLDLRHNGGGFLGEAINLAGLFLPHGPVVQVRDSTGLITVDDDDDSTVDYTGPLAVLVDRFSASASEIVAGALQNYGRAIVVGDASTHGKGTVQTVLEMKSISPSLAYSGVPTGAAKITIQKFYLPNGSSTQLDGIHADIALPSIDEYLPIGESSLRHALIWDRIGSTHFDGQPLDPKVVDILRHESEVRQSHLAEFAYLRQEIAWFRSHQDEDKDLSLNLGDREKEQTADDAFRKRMDAVRDHLALSDFPYRQYRLGPPPPPTPKAASDDGSDPDELSTDDDQQPYKADVDLRETLRILRDAIHLGHNHEYWASNHAPLTVAASNP